MGLTRKQAEQLGLGALFPPELSDREIIRALGLRTPEYRGDCEPPKPSKYHNVRTEYKGVYYDSKAEANRAQVLDNDLALGNIRLWIGQPKFRLGLPECVYVADFLVVTRDWEHLIHVEDVKGHCTPKFKRDLKLWRKYGQCPLWIIMGGKISVIEAGATK